MNMEIIAAPVIGAAIGYITNDVAIRMLFRPHKAVYIGKKRLPFTPGLIPREQGRLAKSVARVVSSELLSGELIEKTLLSEEMTEKIRAKIMELSDKETDRTVKEELLRYISPEEADGATAIAEKKAVSLILDCAANSGIGEKIAEVVVSKLSEVPFVGKMIISVFDEEKIAGMIDEMIAERGEEIIGGLVSSGIGRIMDKETGGIIGGDTEDTGELADIMVSAYRSLVKEKLPSVLRAVNIEKIVEERICALNAAELEKMIMDVMRRELRAIVYLGALLGMIMGFLNLLI